MSHTVLAPNVAELVGIEAMDQCGNEFGSLRELIMWLIRHHKWPPPGPDPGPDPWINQLTNIAVGLQRVVIAADFKDPKMRSAIAMDGIKTVQTALRAIEGGMR